MCGICGIYRRDGGDASTGADETSVRRMTALLERRGPDDEGLHNDGPVTLGNRRLAILDLSPAGHQPMESPGGRYVVTFNGEIYNHREVAAELGLSPADLRSRSDTEVLLRAWERWGPDALPRFVGQWAFAVYDRRTRELWLCRDRFGEKPLYYHDSGGALAFASSIPALLGVPWVPRELDPGALCEYLTLRFVVAPRTLIAGIAKVPPGHWLRAGPGGVEMRRWYAPRFRARRNPRCPGESSSRLRHAVPMSPPSLCIHPLHGFPDGIPHAAGTRQDSGDCPPDSGRWCRLTCTFGKTSPGSRP